MFSPVAENQDVLSVQQLWK